MISAIKLKRCVAGADILGIIVSKLRYRKKPCLIILLEVDESLEISFHHTILPLSLVVRLWIESNKESPLDIKKIV